MEICIGMMGMSPSDFWDCSVREVHAAIDGFMEFNSSQKDDPMTKDELDDLMVVHPDSWLPVLTN